MQQINPLVYHSSEEILNYKFIGFYKACIIINGCNITIVKGDFLPVSPRIKINYIVGPLFGSTFYMYYLRKLTNTVEADLCESLTNTNKVKELNKTMISLKGLIAIIYPNNSRTERRTSRRTGLLYGIFGLENIDNVKDLNIVLTRYSERVGYSRIYVLLLLPKEYSMRLYANRQECREYKLYLIRKVR